MDNNDRMLGLLAAHIMRESVILTGLDRDPVETLSEAVAREIAFSCTSYWLKNAIIAGLERDPVDALNDAEALVEIMKDVCDEVQSNV
jgi:hypothetical protein